MGMIRSVSYLGTQILLENVGREPTRMLIYTPDSELWPFLLQVATKEGLPTENLIEVRVFGKSSQWSYNDNNSNKKL